jgi:hypothetical protein
MRKLWVKFRDKWGQEGAKKALESFEKIVYDKGKMGYTTRG